MIVGLRLGRPERGGERESRVALRHVIGYRVVAVSEVTVAQCLEHLRTVLQRHALELIDGRYEGQRLRLHGRIQDVHHPCTLQQMRQRVSVLFQILGI